MKLIAIITLASAVVLAFFYVLTAPDTPSPEIEFVCYADGYLVERHHGVAQATTRGNGYWVIRYTDGQMAMYIQEEGQTCAQELM